MINDLYGDAVESEGQELLSIAYRNSERLKFLVDDILDTEKLEAGEMRFDMAPHHLHDIVEQGIELNMAYGEQYGVQFRLSADIPEVMIMADKQRMIQVFANVLSNAAKFSKDIRHVDIGAVEHPDNATYIRIAVTDYGDGIAESFQNQVFNRFAQEDSSDVRKLGGTGLGLYISKRIMDEHQGRIDFVTRKDEGTTFFIDIPIYHLDMQEVGDATRSSNHIDH